MEKRVEECWRSENESRESGSKGRGKSWGMERKGREGKDGNIEIAGTVKGKKRKKNI